MYKRPMGTKATEALRAFKAAFAPQTRLTRNLIVQTFGTDAHWNCVDSLRTRGYLTLDFRQDPGDAWRGKRGYRLV